MIYTIVILIVVSGWIAYFGDLLGRRMGKRRLTLFGMRPRHTAIVVTAITGMLIATLTLGTLLAIDSRMRQVVFRGMQLVNDNIALEKKNEAYRVRNRQLRTANSQLIARSVRLTREVNEKSTQVRKARRDAEAALRARDQAQLHVRGLERLIDSRQAELNALKRSSRTTQAQLAQASANLKKSLKELRNVRLDLDKKSKDLSEKEESLAKAMIDLEDATASIRNAERTIQYNEELIRSQRDEIERQEQQLANEIARAERLLRGEVALPMGQEIARTVITGVGSAATARAELIALLDMANKRARDAEAGRSSWPRAVELVYIFQSSGGIAPAREDVLIEKAVEAIVQQGPASRHGVLARIIVVRNTLEGEIAPVELKLSPNNVAFERGDDIAKRIIDGTTSEGRILLAVMDFLKMNVRSAAQARGVVPVASPDPDKATEPISDEQLDDLIAMVDTIRSTRKRVELRAVARQDIYAAGPLNLDNIEFAISTLTRASR